MAHLRHEIDILGIVRKRKEDDKVQDSVSSLPFRHSVSRTEYRETVFIPPGRLNRETGRSVFALVVTISKVKSPTM